jgi:hypothetical protein
MRELTDAQREAIAHVERLALARRAEAWAEIRASLRAAGVSEADFLEAMQHLRGAVTVALAFHPERTSRGGRSVAHGLLADGMYRNQFETGLSSGSVSAFAGGERDGWERRLFGGAYHGPVVAAADRPKYGALFLVAHPEGPAPRFGSCCFVLRPEVSARCTFTFLGSQEDRALGRVGTLQVPEPVLAALLRHVEEDPAPLGVGGLTVGGLVAAMRENVPCALPGVSPERSGRALDSFVEAQVHGPVELGRDVERLVADSAFRGTPTADALGGIASRYGIALDWHPGFALPAAEVPETFRGFPTRRLAERVAPGGTVDAPRIGAAHDDFVRNPEAWRSFGTPSEIRTCFRRLWHVLVLFGRRAQPPTESSGG